jgi:O-acetyl-ADP-ribose deacetylase (regulator of RNase III)
MIQYITGNLLESNAQALVNTVNTVGVMGKGIALQFKKQYPTNYKKYAKACKEQQVQIGQLFVTEEETILYGKQIIINFPTKEHWRKPSQYSYIEEGLKALVTLIEKRKINSIAIPPLGAGNGGLEWPKVKALMEQYLTGLQADIIIYEPNAHIKEILKNERTKLTPARAMLLAVLYDLIKQGEFVSEFAGEKVAYFLQRFGAKEAFNLDYKAYFYGPYSGKVRHVLYHLNGSYITGYTSKDKKPFEPLGLVMDAEKEVTAYLEQAEHKTYNSIVERTKQFLSGFYSDFGLELLSTIDFIIQTENTTEIEIIKSKFWTNRKRTLFSDEKYIIKSLEHLQKAGI